MSYDYTELAAEARRLAGFGVPPPGQAGSPSASSEVEGEQPVLVRDLARVVLQLLSERDEALKDADLWKRIAVMAADDVKHLKRGIHVYRVDHHAAVDRCECDVCAWEGEDEKRRESGDET